MAWPSSIDLVLTADGNVIGNTTGSTPTILDASYGSGRSDWFATLAPGSASFTVLGDLTATVEPGHDLELTRSSDVLWTGKVDTVTLEQASGKPDRTTVTGADIVAQLGEAKVKNEDINAGSFDAQLDEMLTAAGITATVERAPAVGDMGAINLWNNYTGTVLDFVDTIERYANSISAFRPDGTVVACIRSRFPDYAERAYDSSGGGDDAVPDANTVWRMDEPSGNLADNGSAGTFNANTNGTPTYSQTGPWGVSGPDSIAFQKADAADRFTGADSYDLSSDTDFTWAGWCYWAGAAGSDDSILSKMNSGDTDGWEIIIDQALAALRFRVRNASSTTVNVVTPNNSVPTTTWFFWAVVRDVSALRIYIATAATDWVPTLLVTGTAATPPNTAQTLNIGARAGASRWFGGRMSMIAVWDPALTQAQLQRLVILDSVELPEPKTWSTSRSITSVINHWLIGGVAYSDATSIATYGRRTWDVDDSTELSGDVYTADLRDTMETPRPIVTATFDVTTNSSVLITMGPLDVVQFDGDFYQVLDIRHSISTSVWGVTLTLDRTRNDMNDGSPLVPA